MSKKLVCIALDIFIIEIKVIEVTHIKTKVLLPQEYVIITDFGCHA
jgi:hypothetical protein